MISKETQREIDKLLIREIRDSAQKVADTFKDTKDSLMMDFDRERVVDTLYPLQGEILDLLNKVERYAERARRTH